MMSFSEEEKRWLVVGVALRKVLAPRLRTFLADKFQKLYTSLDARYSLKTLSYTVVSNARELRYLEFDNINSNSPKHGTDKESYNYIISGPVDLAKLYLPTNLACFSGFDESLHIKSSLHLLSCRLYPPVGGISFYPDVAQVAEYVQMLLITKWEQCNWKEWNPALYHYFFRYMRLLAKYVHLKAVDTEDLKDDLEEWQIKGWDLICRRIFGNFFKEFLLDIKKSDITKVMFSDLPCKADELMMLKLYQVKKYMEFEEGKDKFFVAQSAMLPSKNDLDVGLAACTVQSYETATVIGDQVQDEHLVDKSLQEGGIAQSHPVVEDWALLDLMQLQKRKLGMQSEWLSEHVDTANPWHEVGITRSNLGDYEGALHSHKEALAMQQKLLGEHVDTALSLYKVGITSSMLGAYEGALRSHKEALAMRQKLLGEHVDTALSLHEVGITQSRLGNHEGALLSHKEALAMRQKLLGEHVDTALSFYEVGITSSMLGAYEGALCSHKEALAMRQKFLGEHVDTALSLHEVGITQSRLGDYEGALHSHKEALAMQQRLQMSVGMHSIHRLHIMRSRILCREAAEFAVRHEECIHALTYGKGADILVITMYMFPSRGEISKPLKKEAEELFMPLGVQLEWVDLSNDDIPVPFVTYSSLLDTVPTSRSSEIAKAIHDNLGCFSLHSNITGIFPSLKVKDFKQSSNPCIAVYVLGKGNIPWGEHSLPTEIDGIPVDVREGFWSECIEVTRESSSPLKLGVSIGREGENRAGTLGALVEHESGGGELFLLSCAHVLHGASQSDMVIVQPSLLDNVTALEDILQDYKNQPECSEETLGEDMGDNYDQQHKDQLKVEMDFLCEQNRAKESKQLKQLEERFSSVYNEPRTIATYAGHGVRGNVPVGEAGDLVFVDAGLAKLEEAEIPSKSSIPLARGPKHVKGLTGHLKLAEMDSEATVYKCGRTTGHTQGFLLTRSAYLRRQRFEHIRWGSKRPTEFMFRMALPLPYCGSCIGERQEVRQEGKERKEGRKEPEPEPATCVRCKQETSCSYHYVLRNDCCESCASKKGIRWDGLASDLPSRRVCNFCRQIKPCKLNDVRPQHLCDACAREKGATVADDPDLQSVRKCEGCPRRKAMCSPYYEHEREERGTPADENLVEEELRQTWCHNCLLIRGNPRMGSFAAKGDSGAVIFDSEGQAVGLLFSCFFDVNLRTIYTLASPMEVLLEKLSEKVGHKLRLAKLHKPRL